MWVDSATDREIQAFRDTHDTRAIQGQNLRHRADTLYTPRSRALHEFRDFPRFDVISY
jgi:hypothetical protein